jgi:nucleoid DNA-binding protein
VNKGELVAAVAKRLGLTKAKAIEITELFFADRCHRLRAQAGRKSLH